MTIYPQNTPKPRTVEIVIFPDVQLLDVAGPLQVFAAANDVADGEGQAQPYRLRTTAQTSPIVSSSGLALVVTPLSKIDQPIDTLIVAGGAGVHAAAENLGLVQWLSHRASLARRIVSICSGAFLLGAAGLLDGKRVATHWKLCGKLAALFPEAQVEVDPIYINDGAIWTSAGVTAGIDLALALVEEDLGHAVELAIARDLVVFLRRHGGQAQFSDHLVLQGSHRDFAQLHSWIAANLVTDLSVTALAARTGMSERSFVRHYKAKTGGTPARAVEKIRLEAARIMLMSKRVPISTIALDCGFGTEETMRRSFLRHFEASPRAYRAGFAMND